LSEPKLSGDCKNKLYGKNLEDLKKLKRIERIKLKAAMPHWEPLAAQ